MIFVKALAALLVILMWGDVVYGLLVERWLSAPKTFRVAVAWIFGGGLVTWGLFVCLWARLPLNTAVILLSGVGGVLWPLQRRWMTGFFQSNLMGRRQSLPPPAPPARGRADSTPASLPALRVARWAGREFPGSLLPRFHKQKWTFGFALVILIQTGLVAFAAAVSPLTDWDAWVNWAGKANVIFAEQGLAAGVYNDRARLPTNLDYPLMLPLLEAWFYTWLGHVHEPAIGWISFLFYATLLLLFYHAARQLVTSPAALGFTALLATVPRLERMGHNGLADIPLATLVLLAFLLLVYGLKDQRYSGSLSFAGALALPVGLMPWLKNEGWLWLMLASVTWWAGMGCQIRQKTVTGRQVLGVAIFYGVVVLVSAGAWQLFLAINGTQRFSFLPITLATLVANLPRLPWIAAAMLRRLLNPYWNFIWLFAGLTLLIRREKVLPGPVGWLILPVAGYVIGLSVTYLFSRFDPYLAHVNNSVERLVVQAAPLALWWLIGQSVAVGWVRGEAS